MHITYAMSLFQLLLGTSTTTPFHTAETYPTRSQSPNDTGKPCLPEYEAAGTLGPGQKTVHKKRFGIIGFVF